MAQPKNTTRWLLSNVTTFGVALGVTASIIVSSIASVASADEFYGFCETEPGHIIANPMAENLHQISQAAESARKDQDELVFSKACQDPRLTLDRPKTGLFSRSIPTQDSRGHRTDQFIKRVGQRVLLSMENEELRLSVREDCLRGRLPASDVGCLDTQNWLKNELTPLISDARMNLALAQTTGQVATLLKKAKTTLNSKLDTLGTHKEVEWSRLSFSEVIVAGDILKEYQSEMREATAKEVREKRLKPEHAKKFENDGLLAARFTNGLTYVEIMSRNPILQYLSHSYPAEYQVADAISKMRANLKSDRAVAEEALRGAGQSDGLKLLDYATHVEAELLESPGHCGLATSLVKIKESRSLGNSLAIGIPLVVASIALPVAGQLIAGTALGAISGAGYVVYSYSEMASARERFISRLNADDATDYNRLDQADREFKISFAMGSAAMAIAPATRLISIGANAARVGAKLSRGVAKK